MGRIVDNRLSQINVAINTVPYSQSSKDNLQNKINYDSGYASDLYTISEEQTFGKQDWKDISVRITHVLPNTNTSDQKKSDDWRNIIFEDMNHKYALGMRYLFDNNLWVTVQSDYYHKPTASAIIRRCDSSFKWYDEYHNLIEEPIMIDYDMRLTKLLFGSEIILPQGHLKIVTQLNDNTKKLILNQRMVFGKQIFKIDYVNDFIRSKTLDSTSVPLIYLTMFKDEVNADMDNMILGVADAYSNVYTIAIDQGVTLNQAVGFTSTLTATVKNNGVVTTQPVTWLSSNSTIGTIDSTGKINLLAIGTVVFTAKMTNNPLISTSITVTVASVPIIVKLNKILPNVTSLLQGTINTQTYNVYHYTNDVPDTNTFSIVASGALSIFYKLSIIDGNHFSVESLGYTNVPLVITCTNNIDVTSTSISINLRGLF